MKYILRDRGHGKTYDMINLSAKKQIPIVVSSAQRANNIESMAHELGLEIPDPIIYYKYLSHESRVDHHSKVLVDDAEDVLRSMLGSEIEALSMTIE